MTIAFNSSPNGYFNRIGNMGQALSDTLVFQKALTTDNIGIIGGFVDSSADEYLIDGIGNAWVSAQTAAESYVNSFIQSLAVNTSNLMVQQDNPQFSATSLQASMNEIIRQMIAGSVTVLKMTVAVSVTANGGNTGNGSVVATSYRPDGLTQENQFAEDIKVSCTSDVNSGATPGNEGFTAYGTTAINDVFNANWPGGSGASATANAINPSSSATLLTGGDFETWTSSVPTGWTIVTGGTTISQGSTAFTGLSSLEITGDGSTLTAIEQEVTVSPLTLYAVNFWIRTPSDPAAGVLKIQLTNGSSVLNDQQGNANSFSITLTGLTTGTWLNYSGVFRTPYILPSTVYLELVETTALSNTKIIFIDTICMAPMTALYNFGPSYAVFGGSADFFIQDFFTIAASNSRGSAGTLNTFQTLCWRMLGLSSLQNYYGLPLQLPSAASPSISDSLIAS